MGDLWVAIFHKPDVLRCVVGVLPGNYYCYVYHGDARRHLVSLPNLLHFSSQQRGQLRLNICHTHVCVWGGFGCLWGVVGSVWGVFGCVWGAFGCGDRMVLLPS